ncbi:cell envelope integrity protein TolA [Chromohalobacter canadensis]|uniref:cell envelope integrity protein TolA n=1 Tax=Chromohalobacter canadensis TaxID=141389 RepID=UPI0021C111E9|nr:cell envelope integrity protein TolA [Chromohalobacter canadensis]MCT8469679.1 cell envelope integrity protein TolA [Chromohalobacter canadensis]MCT8472486.1 cell envelope integrity protein TolA [Chromohalobacter canadensis]MCT8499401.1 cell envelope integrity protein TolA [Chromohalobacter canadensis]
MAKRERRVGYGWPVLLAIGVHVAALMLTIIKWPESESDPTSSSVVQATLVRAETATDQPQQTEDSTPPAAQPEPEEDAPEPEESTPSESSEEPAADNEEEVTDSAVEEAKAEAQRLQEEAQRAAEQRAEAERKRLEEAEAERQRQEEAEAERKRQEEAEAERKRQEEAEAERKRQEEAEAERKRQEEAEAERKRQEEAEAERKRQQELAERAAQANDSSLDSMISDEEQSIANAEQAREAANGFKNLVRRYVEQNWNVPSNASSELRAIVRIQLLPTGELVSATITQSSGNSTFDHSVINAVEKAAPFREMRELDASVKGQFREFNLDFNPEDIR